MGGRGGSAVNDEFNILRDKSFDMHEEEAPVHLSICLSLRRNVADKIISFQVPPREKDPLSKSIKNLRSIHSEISPVREHSSGGGLLLSRGELSFFPI